MAKVRVYELAKEFGVESKAVMAKLQEMGEFVRSASSTIEAPVVRKLKDEFAGQAAKAGGDGAAPKAPAAARRAANGHAAEPREAPAISRDRAEGGAVRRGGDSAGDRASPPSRPAAWSGGNGPLPLRPGRRPAGAAH